MKVPNFTIERAASNFAMNPAIAFEGLVPIPPGAGSVVEVLQPHPAFLLASLVLSPERDVLQQHRVQTCRALLQFRDRELDIAALRVGADDLRGADIGGFFVCVAGFQ